MNLSQKGGGVGGSAPQLPFLAFNCSLQLPITCFGGEQFHITTPATLAPYFIPRAKGITRQWPRNCGTALSIVSDLNRGANSPNSPFSLTTDLQTDGSPQTTFNPSDPVLRHLRPV